MVEIKIEQKLLNFFKDTFAAFWVENYGTKYYLCVRFNDNPEHWEILSEKDSYTYTWSNFVNWLRKSFDPDEAITHIGNSNTLVKYGILTKVNSYVKIFEVYKF